MAVTIYSGLEKIKFPVEVIFSNPTNNVAEFDTTNVAIVFHEFADKRVSVAMEKDGAINGIRRSSEKELNLTMKIGTGDCDCVHVDSDCL